ncbi:MAG: hypothetical protein [Cressdnaviricota sp.]|nr:MAG: hypothetical protein [Cressdnaviricota sp.]
MYDFKVTFDKRGAEIVDSTPFEPSATLGRPPKEPLLAQIQRMVMRERAEAENLIKDEADMMEDQLDFEDNYDPEGLLIPSPYDVADSVADGFSAETYRQEQAAKKNSPKPEDSGTESSGLAGE